MARTDALGPVERGRPLQPLTILTTTGVHGGRRGQVSQAPVAPPCGTSAERRLTLLLCATRERRRLTEDQAVSLVARADPRRLSRLLERLRLTGLVGARVLALGARVDARLEAEIRRWTAQTAAAARTHELTTLAILSRLEQQGIRALALKGSVLAREVYGDVGVRSSGDIDILVAPESLAAAVHVVGRMGWTHQAAASRARELPVLHETLVHPSLPRAELHWRVHWYETRFATDALGRADRPAAHEPLIMQPADGLAALMLFYARDGFAGLRMPADAAAWWDARCDGLDADRLVEETAGRYRELAAPLRVGSELLGALVGLPTQQRAGSWRQRVAAQLATPFDEVSVAEVRAKVGLVDLLLAPPRGAKASLRRERQKIPVGVERPLTRHDPPSWHLARAEHLLRIARRWAVTVAPAAVRASHCRSGTAADLAERVSQ